MTISSDAEAFDLMHRAFGLGGEPFYQERMRNIAIIRAMRKKRNVSLAELEAAINFAKERRRWVVGVNDVFRMVTEAKAAERKKRAASSIDDEIQAAIEHERALPESEWLEILVRSVGAERQEVYRRWLNR